MLEIVLLADANSTVRMTLPLGHYEFRAIGPGGVEGVGRRRDRRSAGAVGRNRVDQSVRESLP
jgi:hypothetical protein